MLHKCLQNGGQRNTEATITTIRCASINFTGDPDRRNLSYHWDANKNKTSRVGSQADEFTGSMSAPRFYDDEDRLVA